MKSVIANQRGNPESGLRLVQISNHNLSGQDFPFLPDSARGDPRAQHWVKFQGRLLLPLKLSGPTQVGKVGTAL